MGLALIPGRCPRRRGDVRRDVSGPPAL